MPTCAFSYKSFGCACDDDTRDGGRGCPSVESQRRLDASGLGRMRSGKTLRLSDYIGDNGKLFVWRSTRATERPDFERVRAIFFGDNRSGSHLMRGEEVKRHIDGNLTTFGVCSCHVNKDALYTSASGTVKVDLSHDKPFLTIADLLDIQDASHRRRSAHDRAAERLQVTTPLITKITGDRDTYARRAEDLQQQLNAAHTKIENLLLEIHTLATAGQRTAGELEKAWEALRELQAEHILVCDYALEMEEEVGALTASLTEKPDSVPLLSDEQKKALVSIARDRIANRTFTFTIDTIRSICEEAGAPEEYERLLNNLSGNTRAQLLSAAPSKAALRTGIRTAFQFLLGLQTTGQHVNLVNDALDLMTQAKRDRFFHAVLGHSERQAQRVKQVALREYDQIVSARIKESCLTPDGKQWKRLFFICDDDFTRCFKLKHFGKMGQKTLCYWTVIGLKFLDDVPELSSLPAQNPAGIDVDRVVRFVEQQAKVGAFRHMLETRGFGEIAFAVDPSTIRDIADNYAYSGASQARLDRHVGSVQLLEILDQQFHSYKDMGCAILRVLCEPTIFRALREGHVIYSVGDYPKQKLQRIFLLAGVNHPDGPQHLAKLFKMCDEALFYRALTTNGLPDNAEGHSILARAAMNLFQLQGPLHSRINPTKDTGNFWKDILIAPLYMRLHRRKQKCPDSLHLREVTALLEIIHAAYLEIRDEVIACLSPIASRFDASALLWLFENTLPLVSYAYDGIFKAGMNELYLDCLGHLEVHAIEQQRRNYKYSTLLKMGQALYLQDIKHPARIHLGSSKQHIIDEDIVETGINTHLTKIVGRNLSSSLARNEALFTFLNRASPEALLLQEVIPEQQHHHSYRDTADYIAVARELLVEIVHRVCQATPDQLPYRSKRHGKGDPWIVPTLTGDHTTVLQSKHVGAPGYALFNANPDKNSRWAPDVQGVPPLYCSMQDECQGLPAATSAHWSLPASTARQLICGHRMCDTCMPDASFFNRCTLCVRQIVLKCMDYATGIKDELTAESSKVEENLNVPKQTGGTADEDDEVANFTLDDSNYAIQDAGATNVDNSAAEVVASLQQLAQTAPNLPPAPYNPAATEMQPLCPPSRQYKSDAQYFCTHPGCTMVYRSKRPYDNHLNAIPRNCKIKKKKI